MRALQVFVLALAVLWGGYWFVGSRAVERGVSAWFDAQSQRGLVAERDSLSVQGFPSRFDLTIDGLRLGDPATGIGWTAPFVQVFSLSYKPWHLIAAFAPEQHITTPLEDIAIMSGKLQGSLVVTPGTALTLDRTTIVGDTLSVASTAGWEVSARTFRFASRRTDDVGRKHEIGIEALEIAPNATFLPDLPAGIDRLHLDAVLSFGTPLDRYAGEIRPGLVGIDLKTASVVWGDMEVLGSGQLTADPNGLAEGRINLHLTNWRKLIPVCVALGWITAEVAPTWENMFGALAAQSGDPKNLDLPLTFRNGRMSVGPLPLGKAPRLN